MIKLTQVSEFIGRGLSPKYVERAETVVLNQRCIRGGTVSLEPARFHDETAKPVPNAKLLQNGDCLINSTGQGTLGRTAVFRHEGQAVQFTVDSHVTIVRPKPDLIDPNFLGHVLKSMESKFEELGTGSGGQIELSRQSVNDSVIPLPPLDEQKRIVATLDEVSASIEQFGEIVMTRSEAVENSVRAWLDTVLASSICGTKALGEGSEIRTGPFGSLLHQSDYADAGVPIVNPINMVNGEIIPDKRVNPERAVELAAYSLEPGDVVVGSRGELGRCAVVQEQQRGWLCGTGSFFVRSHGELIPEFISLCLRSEGARNALERASSGSTMPNISNKTLGALRIPDIGVRDQANLVDAWRERRALAEMHAEFARIESRLLAKLWDAMLRDCLERAA